MRCRYLRALVVSLVLFAGCGQHQKTPPLFRLLTPDQTGVRFANTITTTDSENVQTDVYVYNGAGVAIGDIDNDGLPDIFFSGNMVSSRRVSAVRRRSPVRRSASTGTSLVRRSSPLRRSGFFRRFLRWVAMGSESSQPAGSTREPRADPIV